MHFFSKIIENDMKLSLGVTEPGAIAFAVSRARSLTSGEIKSVYVEINSGIYKNAFTCGIPNTKETGNTFAAALGVVAGNWKKGLASLDEISNRDIDIAKQLIDEGKISVVLHEISSELYIRAIVKTMSDESEVTIIDSHINIVKMKLNGRVIYEQEERVDNLEIDINQNRIVESNLQDFWEYANTVSISEILFIQDAYNTNLNLMNEGLNCSYADLSKEIITQNYGKLISNDELKTAQALTATAIEARVRGLSKPAMSITGSGNHGIICTMPLYSLYKVLDTSEEVLLRATALSYLVTMYIKEHSGKLSAFCGCAIAAGTGVGVGWLFMKNGTLKQAEYVINNMASSLTGIICTGGNLSCVLKVAAAIDSAYKSVNLALNNVAVDKIHGIIGNTPEQTMKNMGLIANPGMVQTEEVIVNILNRKNEIIE